MYGGRNIGNSLLCIFNILLIVSFNLYNLFSTLSLSIVQEDLSVFICKALLVGIK